LYSTCQSQPSPGFPEPFLLIEGPQFLIGVLLMTELSQAVPGQVEYDTKKRRISLNRMFQIPQMFRPAASVFFANTLGLVNLDRVTGAKPSGAPLTWAGVRQLLSQRMLVGIYIGQFCITTLTYFFITWFPVYLVQARHLSLLRGGFAAALPALCGSVGGILGGVYSDGLLRRGRSLTFARKAPIIAGMLLSVTMIACNHTNLEALVMFFMSLAFFGKGFGALGWTVIADTSPKELIGLNGGLFNLFGNTAGITTPIVIGYLVKRTGSFNDALIFVGLTALLAIFSYVVIVGEIKRLELRPPAQATVV